MGFLRKVGRRVKKSIKKLFSTKLGRIVGGIGLSMAMGWAAGKLFEGAKALFSGVAPPVGGETVATATSELVAEKAGQEILEEGLQEGGRKFLEQGVVEESASKSIDVVLNDIKNAKTNSEAFQVFSNDIAAKNISGEFPNIMTNNVTDAVTQVSDVYAGKKPLEPLYDEAMLEGTDLFASKDSVVLKPGATIQQGMENKIKYTQLPEGATIGEKFRRFASSPLESTKQFIMEDVVPQDPAEFAGDIVREEALTAAYNYLYPPEEAPTMPGVVVSKRPSEQAQAAYVQDMSGPWMAMNNTTTVPSFNDIISSLSFGPSAPQYQQQLYEGILPQTLPLPS